MFVSPLLVVFVSKNLNLKEMRFSDNSKAHLHKEGFIQVFELKNASSPRRIRPTHGILVKYTRLPRLIRRAQKKILNNPVNLITNRAG